MSRHAIFLFPSLSEGFGFAALEALAMGMALVTTPTGIGADLLVDRENALVILPASSLHIADASVELIEKLELRQHLAANGRKLAETLTLGRMLNDYEQRLEQALRKHNGR
jgi:glycosyltransferase involved in cell wall biosynthesis